VSRWIRLYAETLHDPKILQLSDSLYRAWTILLCIASEHDGELPPAAEIAILLREKPHRVAGWLTALSRAGLLDNADGVFSPHNWHVRQYKTDKSDPTGAKRAKDYRDRKRDARDASRRDGRDGHDPTTRPETETEADPETDTDHAPKKVRAPDRFDEFWKTYPRRDGQHPRKPAEVRFNALVKSGVDPEMLIAEAKKLHTAESARGNVGTRFIPMAVTWLNQQRWSDHAAVAFTATEMPPEAILEKSVEMFAKTGRWSRWAGSPEPGEPGCRASVELLAKYGLGPDGRKLELSTAVAS
jgi:hypothetical protein